MHSVLLDVDACVPAMQGEQTPAMPAGSCSWPAGHAKLEAVAVALGDAVTAAETDPDGVALPVCDTEATADRDAVNEAMDDRVVSAEREDEDDGLLERVELTEGEVVPVATGERDRLAEAVAVLDGMIVPSGHIDGRVQASGTLVAPGQ